MAPRPIGKFDGSRVCRGRISLRDFLLVCCSAVRGSLEKSGGRGRFLHPTDGADATIPGIGMLVADTDRSRCNDVFVSSELLPDFHISFCKLSNVVGVIFLCVKLEADSTKSGPKEPACPGLETCSGVLDLLIAFAALSGPVAGGGVLERLLGAVNIDRGLFIDLTLVVLHKVALGHPQRHLPPVADPVPPPVACESRDNPVSRLQSGLPPQPRRPD